ncbi:hypothetical protein DL762_005813 [Monosporascus cannonballus]|uniref:Short-chain dehydrogenase n=1 Tax=Monosporascus cannonballus TaxID=155416 RepID=A0ABY0H3T8_9PEZI|nr:hypothetical protein DL762_005813 [Monosporascus cannonballus]
MSQTNFHAFTSSDEVLDRFAPQVNSRTFVITGAGTQSIGGYTALALAKAGPAHLVLVSRNPATVQPVLDEIKATAPNVKATFVRCDLSDQDSVRGAAAQILEAAPAIDVLINNAGVMAIKEYTVDRRGNEMQLSANHIGHFLLTNLLAPALLSAAATAAAGAARVVHLTSAGHRISPFRFDDYNFSGGATYHPFTAYGQSKTANILFSVGLTARLRARGVTSTAVQPGSVFGTRLGDHIKAAPGGFEAAFGDIAEAALRNTGREWTQDTLELKTLTQGSSTTLVAALDPELPARSPAYLANCQITEPFEYALEPDNAERLWELSEQLVGQKFGY